MRTFKALLFIVNNRLSKDHRLKSRKGIQKVFTGGASIFVHPIKLFYTSRNRTDHKQPIFKVGVSVPKRLHKKATTRNLLKRRMREAYRQNKPVLSSDYNIGLKGWDLMFVLIDKEITDYKMILKSIKKLNKRFIEGITRK